MPVGKMERPMRKPHGWGGYVFPGFLLLAALLTQDYARAATPGFTAEDYRKALWMATRFYGGQRSGKGPNWLIMDYGYNQGYVKDADGDHSLIGGWHDCGDFPMFGQTQFYSAYVLLRSYLAFPAGYDDLYDGKGYSDYKAKGAWNYGDGKPNGIPDLLEEVKYATDFFVKAIPDSNTFYFQKGTGGSGAFGEHKYWVTSGYYSQKFNAEDGGEKDGTRPAYKNPKDGSMPSFCAASLAAMSRAYRRFDAAYADVCLKHARFAFAYAKANLGSTQGSTGGTFYARNSNSYDDYAAAAAELYRATGEEYFKEQALSAAPGVKWHNWAFDYANNDDLALANLGDYLQDTLWTNKLNGAAQFLGSYTTKVNAEGVTTTGGNWGRMRYPANAAFIASLYDRITGKDTFDEFIFRQVDFILGDNSAKQSFLTGFCQGCTYSPEHPHHRNVYLVDNPQGEINIPVRNSQHGSLIGGTLDPAATHAVDMRDNYTEMEVCIDYQAGLVGALGYILSKLAPVDTNGFTGAPVLSRPTHRRGVSMRKGAGFPAFSSGPDAPGLDLLGRPIRLQKAVQSAMTPR